MPLPLSDEALRELEAALAKQPSADNAWTTRELVKATGWSEGRVRQALQALIEAGEWESVRVLRPTMAKGIQQVPAYRPKRVT